MISTVLSPVIYAIINTGIFFTLSNSVMILYYSSIRFTGGIPMLVDNISDTRIIITLEDDDLRAMLLDPKELIHNSRTSSAVLTEIVALTMKKLGLRPKRKCLSVESVLSDKGCIISVTIGDSPPKKRYRVKRCTDYVLGYFRNASVLIDAAQRLNTLSFPCKSMLYSADGEGYYLLIMTLHRYGSTYKYIINEYGKSVPCSDLTVVRLNEMYDCLYNGNAVSKFAP